MKNHNFDEVIQFKGTHSVKWENMDKLTKHANDDTLPLWIADMDFACPPAVLTAMHDRVNKGCFGYSYQDEPYLKSVTGWLKKRFDWQVEETNIFLSGGVLHALHALFAAFTEKGDGIIIQCPVYHPFIKIPTGMERKVVNNALIDTDGDYTIDFDDLENKASAPENKVMLFCSPHNPVGRVWNDDELRKVGEICLKHDVLLISDEIHFDLLRQNVTHTPIATLFPETDKIITCTAPSKTFNMAGMHISNIIIENAEYQQKWLKEVGVVTPNPLGLVATQAAYNEGEEWLSELKAHLDDNFKFAEEFIAKHMPKAKMKIPEGTYFLWLNLSGYDLEDEKLDALMLTEANVFLEGGTMFGKEGAGYQRINIACRRATLEDALTRISDALNRVDNR